MFTTGHQKELYLPVKEQQPYMINEAQSANKCSLIAMVTTCL